MNKNKKKDKVIVLSRTILKEELDLPASAIKEELIDKDRWMVCYRIIFKYNGKFYETFYNVGATEMQDERPWEYESKIRCYEVEQKEVLVKQWVNIKEEENEISQKASSNLSI